MKKKKENLRRRFLNRRQVRGVSSGLWELIDREQLWDRLEEAGYVDQVLSEQSYTQEDLLDEAAYLVMSKVGGASGRESTTRRPFVGGGEEDEDRRRQDERNVGHLTSKEAAKQRAVAFTRYLLKLAAEDSRVKQFRHRVLNDDTVSYDEAVALVDSPATALFSCSWFEERGIPFVGHKAQVLEGDWPPSEESSQVRGTVKIEWHGGELRVPFEGVAPFQAEEVWLVGDERVRGGSGLTVLEDSVLGDLWRLARYLSERFSWWGARWMPMLVLMGRAPVIGQHDQYYYQPYSTRYGRDGKEIAQARLYTPITIEVPPWYSVEMVSQIYRGIKERLPTTPVPSERRMAVFEFVVKHPEVRVLGEGQRPKVPSWRKLLHLWNQQHPDGDEWHYPDPRNFSRDFGKAFDLIVNYYRDERWKLF